MDLEKFAQRLSQLRSQRGLSARDLSLSLGQASSYINQIENQKNYPSMAAFFYICDFLEITPMEFFNTEESSPILIKELVETVSDFSDEQIEYLIQLLKSFK